VTSETVRLDPGTYLFSAKLPNGAQWSRVVRVSGTARTVFLEPEGVLEADPLSYFAGPVGVHESPQLPAEEGSRLAARSRTMAARAAPQGSGRGRLRHFLADPLRGTATRSELPQRQWSRRGDAVHLRIPPSPVLSFVQLLQTSRVPVNIALPTSPLAGCVVVLLRRRKRFWMEVHLDNSEGNLLLGYKRNQAAQEAAITAERLLAGKFDDPIAASAGAYSLFRFGALEKLHDWPANLHRSFPWLPDGAAIRGEQLARLGQHEEAFDAFLQCADRGLPLFSDGIDFLHQRLKLYTSADTGFAADALERAGRVLARLQAIAGYIDFNQALTTVGGIDPGNPDAEPVKRLPADGEDLAALFGRE
jgi:hypothetical protein